MAKREARRRGAGAAVLLVCLIAALVLPPSARAAFDAHGGPVKSVAVSADGRLALTASFDTTIILWDLAGETVRAEFEGHDAAVNAVAFLPGDRQALSASDDGSVVLWDLENAEPLARFDGHDGKVVAVAISPDGAIAASAGWDRTVRLWDLEALAPMQVLAGRDNMNAVHFSDDGEAVVAGASDGELAVWRVADGTRLAAIPSHDFAVTGLAGDGDDGMVATSSVDETVRLWDLAAAAGERSERPVATLYGHDGPVLAVDLSADGELVASGGVDGTVRVWRRGDGDRLNVFARHRGPVWSVAFSPDGDTLLSGGADGLVLTYDLDAPAGIERPVQAPGLVAPDLAAPDPTVSDPTAAPPNGLETAAIDGGVDRGEQLFRTCSACHTLTPDDGHRAGPTLHRLFGRTAGSHPDYRYSEALEKSDLVWTEDTIDQLFAIGPEHLLPGTKMPLQRMPDERDRADLIAFLKRATTP